MKKKNDDKTTKPCSSCGLPKKKHSCDPVDMKTDSSEKLGELEKESTRLNITVAPGPLGVGIQTTTTGQCFVYSKSNTQSPLEVNDIILSLSVNGIELSKESGFYAWGKMFKTYSLWTRNLVVLRSSPSSSDCQARKQPRSATVPARPMSSPNVSDEKTKNKKRKATSTRPAKDDLPILHVPQWRQTEVEGERHMPLNDHASRPLKRQKQIDLNQR